MINETIRFQSDGRYYVATLKEDLLGDIVVHRIWGGLLNRRGGQKIDVFGENVEAARKKLLSICRTRYRHGYSKLPDKH